MPEQIRELEIDLRQYVKIMIKRKWIILSIFLVFVVAAAIISKRMAEIYEVSMIIKAGSDLDSPKNIESRIKQKGFDVLQHQGSDLIKIGLREKEEKIKSGTEALTALFIELSDAHKENIAGKKNEIEEEISIVSKRITSEEDAVELEEKKIRKIEENEKYLSDDIEKFKDDTKKLIAQRDILLGSKGRAGDVISLFEAYSGAIQQNIAYLNYLNTHSGNLKAAEKDAIAEIKNLKTELDDLELEKDKLILKKDNISNIRLFQKPEVSQLPIKGRYVSLAGILGLMCGTLLAFFMEYLEKRK